MSVLRSIESKIEGLFEGVFGRAFRTHVQPVELARKLAKEMDEHRSVSVSRVYVPNEYTVYLSAADREQFSSYEASLIGELQEYLAEHARREGYALLTQPQVRMTTDEDLAIGEFGIATQLVQAPTAAATLPAPATATPVVPEAPEPPEPAAVPTPEPALTMIYKPPTPTPAAPVEPEPAETVREQVSLELAGRSYPVTTRHVVLGRSRECDVQVPDHNVSRRHVELRQEGATWWLEDLGSTNGTEVNGRRVARAKLADGDRIRIGGTDVVFGRSAS